jgi:acetyl-CoA carboxylase biotin carboxyl carrier protein
MATTTIRADIGASVWKITAPVGAQVGADDTILILESMKMEIPVQAPHAGTLLEVLVAEGQAVEEGEPLATLSR